MAGMALELRPNCEGCDKDLPPDTADAMICSYECTWCTACVDRLRNVCPNCGGGFMPRPSDRLVNGGRDCRWRSARHRPHAST